MRNKILLISWLINEINWVYYNHMLYWLRLMWAWKWLIANSALKPKIICALSIEKRELIWYLLEIWWNCCGMVCGNLPFTWISHFKKSLQQANCDSTGFMLLIWMYENINLSQFWQFDEFFKTYSTWSYASGRYRRVSNHSTASFSN